MSPRQPPLDRVAYAEWKNGQKSDRMRILTDHNVTLVYSPFDVRVSNLPQSLVKFIVIFHRVDNEAKTSHVDDRMFAQLEK